MTVIYAEPPPEEVRTACPRCSGTGEIIHKAPLFYRPGGLSFKVRQCPNCRGDGYLVATRGVAIVPLIPPRR